MARKENRKTNKQKTKHILDFEMNSGATLEGEQY